MTSIRAISLDLDDTLWPVGPVIAAAEEALLDWLRCRYPDAARGHDAASMRAMRVRIAAQFPERSHDLTFLRRRALAAQFAAAGYAQSLRGESLCDEALCDEALEVFLAARNRVEFYDDVRPALTRLRARYRLFAVSNGNADLHRCGVGELFDGHVTAISAGAAKPAARIFAALIEMAGVRAAEIMHVGDDPVADVLGASQAGMQSVWLNRGGVRDWPATLPPPARTISTLAEIS
jgi:FMN hydrolase / 5-amino-6-(5-phospho-D-ribitylamino)uracil phosphatase